MNLSCKGIPNIFVDTVPQGGSLYLSTPQQGLHILPSFERVHFGKGERVKTNFTVVKPDKLLQPGDPRLTSTVINLVASMYPSYEVKKIALLLCDLPPSNAQLQCNHEKNSRQIPIEGHYIKHLLSKMSRSLKPGMSKKLSQIREASEN